MKATANPERRRKAQEGALLNVISAKRLGSFKQRSTSRGLKSSYQKHAAQAFNDAKKYLPHCELFFFFFADPIEAVPPSHLSTESLFFLRAAGCSIPLKMTI